jgi:hypothetical protein
MLGARRQAKPRDRVLTVSIGGERNRCQKSVAPAGWLDGGIDGAMAGHHHHGQ